ncbi:helix-turn-helix transcriptional regulator [Roseateles paludis]|uniref:WYL domain-containing protein n=1 Tax=Roseateles paludis TaxID=3145238 RepID=A0ABV0FVU4_9BURK
MANTLNRLEARFQRLESVLLWEGQIDNTRVRDLFGIQNVQASRLLREFSDAHPHGLQRESALAAYVATPRFRPAHASGTLEEYMAQLDAGSPIRAAVEDTRLELTLPDPAVFSVLVRACVSQAAVKMRYRSMTTPDGRVRLIYPHALVRAGRRWHARAWCFEREEFRDFAITRVETAALAPEAPPRPPSTDRGWNTEVEIELIAHPALTPPQARLIAFEHLASQPSRVLKLRSCLVEYVLQDLRVAVDLTRQQPPEYQLAVADASRVERYLFQGGGGA